MAQDQRQAILPIFSKPAAALAKTCVSGLVLVGVFVTIFCVGSSFEYGAEPKHNILVVTGLLMGAGVCAFVGLNCALRVPQEQQKALLLLIFSFALSTRLVAVFTNPILEVDFYRYLWDGKVVAAGVSPYRYAPEQVLNSSPTEDDRLGRLKRLAIESETNFTILSRIHFESHTTIYPPVSQAVFALSMKWLPSSTSVGLHIVAMKLVLVLFDIGTMLLVLWLLRKLDVSAAWLIVYAWNPLVIKEIANSAHLDSIATFFLLLSIALLIGWRAAAAKTRSWLLCASAITLAGAVGAKLFPVILLPAMAVFVARQSLARGVLFSVVFAATSAVILLPMLRPVFSAHDSVGPAISDTTEAKDGAVEFFSQWRMNDTLFSCVYFNLKDADRAEERTPWFVFTGAEFRAHFEERFRALVWSSGNPAFLCARVLTLGVFCAFYLWQLRKLFTIPCAPESSCGADCLLLLKQMGLVLTVFLLLQPTVNPWYFVWVMPVACFCTNGGWLIASGVMLGYYARFWFMDFQGKWSLGGATYEGVAIYDHIGVWIVTIFAGGLLGFFRLTKIYETDSPAENHALEEEHRMV